MHSRLVLVPLIFAAACAPRAFTPNARAFAFDSPTAPEVGEADLQADLASTGTVFGPSLVNGGLRYRKALHPAVVAEAEGGLLHLTNEGSGGSRNAYTGRLGVMLRPSVPEGVRTALTAGVGGGLSSAAGNWASVDAGFAFGGSYRYLRPFVGGDVSYNASLGDVHFTVNEPDGTATTLHLPDTLSLRGTAGVELGRPEAAVVLGFAMARMMAREADIIAASGPSDERRDEVIYTVGIGFRLALDQARSAD